MMMITGHEKEELRDFVSILLERLDRYSLTIEVITDIISELAENKGLEKVQDICIGCLNDWDIQFEEDSPITTDIEESELDGE